MSDNSQDSSPFASPMLAYHERTKHRFEAFAPGPGQLDWDAQPAAFRHYPGAPILPLPLSADGYERGYGQLGEKPDKDVAADLDSLGALLELGVGLSAWKSWGPNRWALRCNPSSGNLHPVEAYVLCAGLPGVPDGLHHYDPEQHGLEGRALCETGRGAWLAVGLSSVMWREAWKYGERAFRYCQLDVGHALGALCYAAALIGWEVVPLAVPSGALAHCLGLDRPDDFPTSRHAFTEAEEPEILVAIHAPGLGAVPLPGEVADWLAAAHWHGRPSCIDPAPGYRWPGVDQAAAASRPQQPEPASGPLHPAAVGAGFPDYPPLLPHQTRAGAAQLIRQRRSGQRFDPRCWLPKSDFYRILDAVLPRPRAPFLAQEAPPAIQLLLFVMRVEQMPRGLYLLPRSTAGAANLAGPSGMGKHFAGLRQVSDFDPDSPPHLGLIQLAAMGEQEIQRLARALSCHQDIASTSAFSLGMVGDFSAIAGDGYGYRRLLREAGLIGQALYLEAEAVGVRGTGIGCFFDDPVHRAFGIGDPRWQSVYHFTIGTPVTDSRIETGPPYPQRHREQA